MTNVPSGYTSLIAQMSQATGLPQNVIAAQANEESGFNANAVSPTGAEGWLQFEPSTYNAVATQAGVAPGTEFNPADESKAYDVYMSQLLNEEGGSVQKALEAYNAGPGDLAAGAGYANTILSNAGSGNITVPGTTTTGSATTTSFPGGVFDPLNLPFPGGTFDPLNIPAEAGTATGGVGGEISSAIGSGIETAIEGVFGNIMTSLGFKSGKDFLIRAGLIIMGAIILIIGVKSLVGSAGNISSGSQMFSGASRGPGDDGGESDSEETTDAGDSSVSSASKGSSATPRRPSAVVRSPSSKTKAPPRKVVSGKMVSGKAVSGEAGPGKALGKKAIETAVVA